MSENISKRVKTFKCPLKRSVGIHMEMDSIGSVPQMHSQSSKQTDGQNHSIDSNESIGGQGVDNCFVFRVANGKESHITGQKITQISNQIFSDCLNEELVNESDPLVPQDFQDFQDLDSLDETWINESIDNQNDNPFATETEDNSESVVDQTIESQELNENKKRVKSQPFVCHKNQKRNQI